MRSKDSVIISVRSIINLRHTGRNFISRSNETFVQLHECKRQLGQRSKFRKGDTRLHDRDFGIMKHEWKAELNKLLKEFPNTVQRPFPVTSTAFHLMLVSSITNKISIFLFKNTIHRVVRQLTHVILHVTIMLPFMLPLFFINFYTSVHVATY